MDISLDFRQLIDQILDRLMKAEQAANTISNNEEIKLEITKQISFIIKFKSSIEINTENFPIHYMNNIYDQLKYYKEHLPASYNFNENLVNKYDFLINKFIKNQDISGKSHFIGLTFTIHFFEQLNYLTSNMVLIGANGSGKSSLAGKLKDYLGIHSVVISAQKLLTIPEFESIANPKNANAALITQQNTFNYIREKGVSAEYIPSSTFVNNLAIQFKILINNLLAERAEALHIYIENVRSEKISNDKKNIPETNLDKVIKIWNILFPHRTLFCKHLNIAVKTKDIKETEYTANEMSDGEKVALYYISNILQAPKNSLVIIDEPEMYLHKTILIKLWDILEKERSDCKYLYLTHDIDFAISRSDAKKFWMQSFEHPVEWKISEIENTEELPENLLLELVGSRKNILFCEGEVGKSDDEIYKIIFPNFTVKPVGSCTNVINFTRAFNKINNLLTKAFGLIDSDHSPNNRLDKLAEDLIFSLQVAEIENLLLDEDLLKIVVNNSPIDYSQKVIDEIKKKIISALRDDIESQAASYVSAEIDFYFKEANLKEGRTMEAIENNFQSFITSIQINDRYNQRINTLNDILCKNNYLDVLKVYNNKGLIPKTHKILEISSYKKLAIKILKKDPEARESLKKHFPEILITEGYNLT